VVHMVENRNTCRVLVGNGLCGGSGHSLEINPLNAELNPICHLLALLGAHHILHVSRIRVNIKIHLM